MKAVYQLVLDDNRFRSHEDMRKVQRYLEGTIKAVFPESVGFKLIGSAATGTLTRDSKDLDYVVLFEEPVIPNPDFRKRWIDFGSPIRKSKEEKEGHMKLVGDLLGFEFVVVPSRDPKGNVRTLVDDAFYHPDFIKSRAAPDHVPQTILAKTFFKRAGVYKKVQGIGTELLILRYRTLDTLLRELASGRFIRVNFSDNSSEYSADPLIVDYPHVGGKSLVKPISLDDYVRLGDFAQRILHKPEELL